MDSRNLGYRHIEVDPWELCPVAPEDESKRICELRV
jgi:hypothetical protein